jgi:aspartyl-tRNA(Asn)/glutamyl-tRNA(Gln) amidotransferase subunit B
MAQAKTRTMKYKTVIGLEVHVQLLTKSKMFCSCSTAFGREPNSQVCPVCLGLPGSLPVLNKEVFNLSIKAALALKCKINFEMRFDRKNYFYPDLPKGYQISQLDMPLASGGRLDITTDRKKKTIRIGRVHLEEDAGKLIHTSKASLVDFNRGGVPLIEVVTEPDINSPDEAYRYLKELKGILNYLEVSDCNMQEGSLRCDANVSVNPENSSKMGVKTEVKNMNSFKAVRNALSFEVARQQELYEKNEKLVQETRLWDENKNKTYLMRTKEEAHDYRYFPEPDLPMFEIKKEDVDQLEASLPELPAVRLKRFIKEYGLTEQAANFLVSSKSLAGYFEECCQLYDQAQDLANWLMGPVVAILRQENQSFAEIKLKPNNLVEMLKAIKEEKINRTMAKEIILPEIIHGQKTVDYLLKEKDITQVSDKNKLAEVIDEVIKENPKAVKDFHQGKKNAIMYLVGRIMKETKGKANPKIINEMLIKRLRED